MPFNRAFRKLMSKSLFISVPNSFLKPKSVYGLIYLSLVSSDITLGLNEFYIMPAKIQLSKDSAKKKSREIVPAKKITS